MKKKKDASLSAFGIRTLSPFLKPYRKMFLTMIFCTIAVGVLDTLLPLFQKYAIDTFIAGQTLDGLLPFILLYLLVLLSNSVIDYFGSYGCCKIEMFVLRDMRRALFNHLQTLSVSYFNTNSVGRVHARVMSDTNSVTSVISWAVYMGGWHLTYVLSAIVIMFILQPVLALCVVIIVPIVALVSLYFQRKLTKLNHAVRETNAKLTADFNEGITGVETSKTLAIEQSMDQTFGKHAVEMEKNSNRLGHHRALFGALIAFTSSLALALVLWYGGVITVEQVIQLGTLSVFMTYAQGLMEPVQWSVEAIADFISVKVNLQRIHTVLTTQSDVKDTPEVIEKYGDEFNPKRENWEPIHGEVTFEDVTFRYPDGTENVLEHFNLTVPQGATVAIVGETGAGKSTLVNLVCRFYEPTQGKVLIDGKDVRERSVGWLHGNIGYVLQTPHLFSGTVRENLLYGNLNATQEQLEAAVAAVNAQKIIERMDGGYDAVIGEGGNNLSTGEKQLLSFARAILADPAIFVLDEATASIDTLTESLIQQAIETLMQGRTSFVIAHRLSTVRSADVILLVHEGKIIERGTHEELLKAKGAYYDLYVKQFQEENVKRS